MGNKHKHNNNNNNNNNISIIRIHTCHILPPSEIDLGLRLAAFAAREGNIYFTELAERVEYGNYVIIISGRAPGASGPELPPKVAVSNNDNDNNNIIIIIIIIII